MVFNFVEFADTFRIAIEALGRYKLRTSLSVLGVVLGVAAVIAMMSVSKGAEREALAQVEALGLDNLVARSTGVGASGGLGRGLSAGDAERAESLVPLVINTSPLLSRYVKIGSAWQSMIAQVIGIRPAYRVILRLSVDRGRFLSTVDEQTTARRCVLGASLSRELFGYRNPIGEQVRLAHDYYEVVGVLREIGTDSEAGSTLAWHDINRAALVPFPTLSGRTLDLAPGQHADEIWLQMRTGERAGELGQIFHHVLASTHAADEFTVVVPRELLAQRYRTQRTFSVVVGSVAALALLVGGIGIMNIMLTSVVERTREIGVRRTVGATRRAVRLQFLIETLMMTVGGGALGIAIGVVGSWGISAFAGWRTQVSLPAVVLGFFVSLLIGLVFGLYPAMKAAGLEPVDAMRYE
jgi:putative ABC transport system permease protein